MKQVEHRGKVFRYSEEAEQDAKSQWGIDLSSIGQSGIEVLIEDGVEFSSMKITIERVERGLKIGFEPDADA